MLFKILISLLLAIKVASFSRDKRDTVEDVTIYAYGTNITGLPVLAGPNGIAYVSSAPSSDLSPCYWNISTTGDEAWTVNIMSNTMGSTASKSTFYIIKTTDAFEPAGFLNSKETAPAGAETIGFWMYGSNVAFMSSTTLEAQFWAKASSIGNANVWEIVWNESGENREGSVPVTLKTTAPIN